MYLVEQTESFAVWLSSLRDLRAQLAIGRRLERAAMGNLGDVKWLGGGVGELRIDVVAGYRVYFAQKGQRLVLLLVGGDQSTQATDILKARKLLKEMK
ncbi:MAG: type II toxin-antitoxin system RelE/ParE family toxin [Pseudomonas asiatica]|uniref:type II toxin-antitoxin system RelE/ParE family toxin n=1 Tax=Pseudomonas sp. KCJK8751 TaxID=3344564 RepID=UPI003905945C